MLEEKLRVHDTFFKILILSCCTSSVLTGSFKLGSVKLNKGTVVTKLTVFNFFCHLFVQMRIIRRELKHRPEL